MMENIVFKTFNKVSESHSDKCNAGVYKHIFCVHKPETNTITHSYSSTTVVSTCTYPDLFGSFFMNYQRKSIIQRLNP